eukprot:360655-Chlamydomonas_euryale.AAC.2
MCWEGGGAKECGRTLGGVRGRCTKGAIPLCAGAALVQSTQNGALCFGGKNGLRGSRNFSSSCQVGQRAKAEGATFTTGPRVVNAILCQAGQRGLSAPMESPPKSQLARIYASVGAC